MDSEYTLGQAPVDHWASSGFFRSTGSRVAGILKCDPKLFGLRWVTSIVYVGRHIDVWRRSRQMATADTPPRAVDRANIT